MSLLIFCLLALCVVASAVTQQQANSAALSLDSLEIVVNGQLQKKAEAAAAALSAVPALEDSLVPAVASAAPLTASVQTEPEIVSEQKKLELLEMQRRIDFAVLDVFTPTVSPTAAPTEEPTLTPSAEPTFEPSAVPTAVPTVAPSAAPTAGPTAAPSQFPTARPTVKPSSKPTAEPTLVPTHAPSLSPKPSFAPTLQSMPVVTVTASLFFTGASTDDITPEDDLAIRTAMLQQLQSSVEGLTVDNLRIVGTEVVTVRKLLAVSSSVELAATTKVKVIVEIVLPLVDFQQYASDPSALTNTVSNAITTSVSSGAFTSSLATLITSSTVFTSGTPSAEVEVEVAIQYPPTAAPTVAPTNFKMDEGQVAGITVAVIFGSLFLAAVLYKVLLNIRAQKGPQFPISREADVNAHTSMVVSMDQIFATKDDIAKPDSVAIQGLHGGISLSSGALHESEVLPPSMDQNPHSEVEDSQVDDGQVVVEIKDEQPDQAVDVSESALVVATNDSQI
jgi:hypothetical protein